MNLPTLPNVRGCRKRAPLRSDNPSADVQVAFDSFHPTLHSTPMNALTDTELEVALSDLAGWEVENDKLTKLMTFESFRDAMTFLMRLAFEIEDMNHHPEIENVYNKVRFSLTTHDAGSKVTEKDIKLARQIENLRG